MKKYPTRHKGINSFDEIIKAVETMSASFYCLDQNLCITYVNKAFESELSKKKDELIGKNIKEIMEDDFSSTFLQLLSGVLEEQKETSIQLFDSAANRWYESYIYPTEEGLSVIRHDITERQQHKIAHDPRKDNDDTERLRMEEELRRNRERLSLVILGSKSAIWDWDMRTRHLYCDKQWKAILGYEDHEIQDSFEKWRSLFHPEDVLKIEQTTQACLTGEMESFQEEYRLCHKDGSYRWVLATGTVIFDKNHQPMRFVGSFMDITERKMTRTLAVQMEERLRDFAQAVPDACFIIDEDGRHIEIFGNYKMMIPFPKEELLGRTVHEIMPGEDADVLLNEIRQCIATNRPRYRIDERKMGEDSVWIEGRVAPMSYLVNGKRTAAVVLTNVTQQRQAEEMLRFTYKLGRKSDFFNDILHGKVLIDEKVMSKAKSWGIDFSIPLGCCLLSLKDPFSPEELQKENPLYFQIQKNDVIRLLSRLPECVVWDCRENIGVFYQGRTGNKDDNKGKIVAAQIKERLGFFSPRLKVLVGISEVHTGLDSLERSFHEAQCAINSAQCAGFTEEGVCFYRELGLMQILSTISEQKDVPNYVQRMIGPLLDYDLEKGTDLLQTLEEILGSAHLKEAADKMYLHHKTLVFRKRRIEKILGVSLDSFDTKLALGAAIKLYKLKTGTNW